MAAKPPKIVAPATPEILAVPLKGHANQQNLPIELISIKEGFNPRTVLGDISELVTSLKTHGLINPITVCPSEDPGHFYVVAGARRYTGATEAKLKTVPVVIRHLNIDSDEAYALAVAENSGDVRTELSPMDQAAAFSRLLSAEGATEATVAKACSYSRAHIRNTVKLLAIPQEVRARLESGELSKRAAIATLEIPEEVRERILPKLVAGTTEADVHRLANAAKAEIRADKADETEDDEAEGAPVAAKRASNKNRPPGQSPGTTVIVRGQREIRRKIDIVAVDMLNALEDGKAGAATAAAKSNQLAALLWQSGIIADIDVAADDFLDAVDDIKSRLVTIDDEEEAPAPAVEEPAPKKKAKAAKMAVEDTPEE